MSYFRINANNVAHLHKGIDFVAAGGQHIVSFALLTDPFPQGVSIAIADYVDGICTRAAHNSTVSTECFNQFKEDTRLRAVRLMKLLRNEQERAKA